MPTPWQVLTGRPPFENYPSIYTVILKVVTGSRPKKPPSLFSDVLWKLLKESWVEEYARRSRRRPPVSTILDCLRESADHWEKSQSCECRICLGKRRGLFIAPLQ